jgi:hypothetical protein
MQLQPGKIDVGLGSRILGGDDRDACPPYSAWKIVDGRINRGSHMTAGALFPNMAGGTGLRARDSPQPVLNCEKILVEMG